MTLEVADGLNITKRRGESQGLHPSQIVNKEITFLDSKEFEQQLPSESWKTS